jgi:putative Mg2+ transporter-C (MgtC) family protein
MACGAGLPWLALAATGAYFVIALVFPLLMRLLPGDQRPTEESPQAEHD